MVKRMKRKYIFTLLLAATAVSFSACGNTDNVTIVSENTTTTQTMDTDNTTAVSESAETAQSSETEEMTTMSETTQESLQSKDLSQAPTEEVVEEMLGYALNWTGMQYFYNEDSDISQLTANEAIAMAAHAANSMNGNLEEDADYNLIVPKDVLDNTMADYFGKTYDLSEYTNPDYSMVQVTDDGTVLLQQGDWGTIAPKFTVKSIEPDESTQGAFLATVDYFAYDYEESKELDVHYEVVYKYQPCEESQFGYCITDLQATAPANGTLSNPKN